MANTQRLVPRTLAAQRASRAIRSIAFVAIAAIGLGFLMQGLIVLARLLAGGALPGAGLVADLASTVSWSVLVCTGVAIGVSLGKARAALAESGLEAEETPLSPWGLRLPGRVALHRDGSYVGMGRFELVAPGDEVALGFGADDKPFFWVGDNERVGEGTHVAFAVDSRAKVDAFYEEALAAGGSDHGAPGLRPHYHPNYYAAFVFDPDGNNIEAVSHRPE